VALTDTPSWAPPRPPSASLHQRPPPRGPAGGREWRRGPAGRQAGRQRGPAGRQVRRRRGPAGRQAGRQRAPGPLSPAAGRPVKGVGGMLEPLTRARVRARASQSIRTHTPASQPPPACRPTTAPSPPSTPSGCSGAPGSGRSPGRPAGSPASACPAPSSP
jgi:hypothetical protein